MDNSIYAYYQGIKDGSIVVGRWVRLLYERIVHGIEDGTYIFDQGKANNAIRFIETFVRHNKGSLAPGLLKLSLWQKAAISCIFGIVDSEGNRQFREVLMVIGRKCGKTLLASAIMSYMVYAEGEYGQEVYCIAPKLDQSDLVYSAFEFTVDHTPAFASRTRKRGRIGDLYVAESNSTIKKIAFSEKRADGYNPQLTIADEIASWPGDRGLKQYEVMISGTGARKQPLMVAISSAGYVNEGIYDELFKRSTRVLQGDSQEKRLLPFLYTIDDPRKWNDINELRKSLPGLGVSIPVDFILDEINTASESLSKRSEFLCKYTNTKQSSSMAWLPETSVLASAGKHMELSDFANSYAVAGIDLSRTTDLTAATLVVEKNGILNVFAHFWLPTEKIDEATARDGLPYQIYIQRGLLSPSGDNVIDYRDVYAWFTSLIEDYRIYPLQVGYDRYSAQYLIQDLKGYGFQVDDVFQGTNLTPVIRETEGLLRDGKIHIGDNDLLKVHLLDSALKVDAESERCKLVKLRKNGHIDGTAALLCAMCVRQKHWQMIGDQLKNED